MPHKIGTPAHNKRVLVDGKLFCPICKVYKPLEEFHNCRGATFERSYYCKMCACENGRKHNLRYLTDPEYKKRKRQIAIKYIYGISLEQREEILVSQNYECAICKVKLLTSGHLTHLDHSHKTGKIRAFLCTNCNRGLGHFQDNPDLLRTAAIYLDTHIEDVDLGKG